MDKCQFVKLGEFTKCKKKGLKEQTILDNTQLEACMGVDEKLKIDKTCNTKLADKLSKKCTGVIIADAFPGECSDSANLLELRSCLDRLVECRVCLALNAADALDRDCDDFDDAMPNGSCP